MRIYYAPKQLVEHSLHCNASSSFMDDCDTVTNLNNYFGFHVCLSFRSYVILWDFKWHHKMSMIKVPLYVLRVMNMHSGSPGIYEMRRSIIRGVGTYTDVRTGPHKVLGNIIS